LSTIYCLFWYFVVVLLIVGMQLALLKDLHNKSVIFEWYNILHNINKMKRLFAVLFVSAISISAFSQSPVIQWQKTFGGSSNEDAYSIQPTKDGGYVLTGPSESNNAEVTGNHGNQDYWVVKINDTGGIQWETSLGGSGDEVSYCIQQTSDLGYIVAGGSTTDSNGDVICSPGIEEWEFWMVKLSATGSIEWQSCYGNPGPIAFAKAYALQQTSDSGYIVAGEATQNGGEVTGNHGGNGDFWVIKVSETGNLEWEKSLGGSSLDLAKSVQQTTDGGYIVAGSSSSTDFQVTGNHGGSDYWVVKLNDTGAIQWEKSLGGSEDEDCYAIQQTIDGGYIAGGSSNSNDSQVTGNHGEYDYWVVKLNDTGAIQWEISLGGAGNENCYSIRQTADSGYIVAGTSDSSTGEVTGTKGGSDFWLVKLSSTGIIQWEKAVGGSQTDVAYSVQQTADSGYIVAGETNSADGDITMNYGLYDFWVVKLSACVLDSPVIILTGDTLSTALTYNSYQWQLNGTAIPGATNAIYIATVNGTYALNVSDTNNCTGASALYDISGLGVSTIASSAAIHIMPNPTTGIINITGAGQVNISVYDVVGQMVKQAYNAEKISISDLPSGMYFIKLTSKDGQIIKQDKVIKE